jgi:hypothetical protein
MKKKHLAIALTVLFLTALALQNGAAYGYRPSRIGFGAGTPNAVIIYQPAPFDLRAGYDFTEGSQFLFLSADWRPTGHIQLNGPLHFYFGIGAYGKLYPEAESENLIEGGTRIPVGLSLLFFDNAIELFIEVAPGFDLYPKPAFSADPVQFWAGLTFAIR